MPSDHVLCSWKYGGHRASSRISWHFYNTIHPVLQNQTVSALTQPGWEQQAVLRSPLFFQQDPFIPASLFSRQYNFSALWAVKDVWDSVIHEGLAV